MGIPVKAEPGRCIKQERNKITVRGEISVTESLQSCENVGQTVIRKKFGLLQTALVT